MNKHPIVLPYISNDGGRELRCMLRSLKNIQNFNGEVYIVGDKEEWFSNITHIPVKRLYGKPYADQRNKMAIACTFRTIPDTFIAMMDDVYITEPLTVGVYVRGELPIESNTVYGKTKVETRKFLSKFVHDPLYDYECHTPMLVDKLDLLTVLVMIDKPNIQWRSVYGNIYRIPFKNFKDKKTRSFGLPKGKIISSNFYIGELEKLYPTKSEYEC